MSDNIWAYRLNFLRHYVPQKLISLIKDFLESAIRFQLKLRPKFSLAYNLHCFPRKSNYYVSTNKRYNLLWDKSNQGQQ